MVAAADDERHRRGSRGDRALRLPDLRLVLGHVHRQLDELPDRGARPVAARQRLDRWPPTPTASGCSCEAGRLIVDLARRYYEQDDASVLPRCDRHLRGVRERHDARHRHGRLDQHRAAPAGRRARRRASTSPWPTSTGCRAACPCLCKVAPSSRDVHMEDVHRAGGIMAILGELDRAGLLDTDAAHGAQRRRWATRSTAGTSRRTDERGRARASTARPRAACRRRSRSARAAAGTSSTSTARSGVIRDAEHAFSQGRRPGRALRQPRARRLHREDRRRRRQHPDVLRPGARLREPGRGGRRHPAAARSRPATSWSSATKARAAGRACRRCSTRPAT